jgi:hypothetical protein
MKKLVVNLFSLSILLILISVPGQRMMLAQQTAQGSVFLKHTIENAPELDEIYVLVAVDVDGDQDIDIIGANGSPGNIVWWENDGSPEIGAWSRHSIGTTSGSRNLAVADLDGDKDIDIIAPDPYSDEVLWFENDGTPGNGEWTEYSITNTAVDIYDVAAADLDGDDDIDVVKLSNHTQARPITWYENDGTPASGGWLAHKITDKEGTWSIETVDMDLDNDFDILVAADDQWGLQETNLFYYTNNGVAGWEFKGIDTGISSPGMACAQAGDADGDMDMDVVSTYRYGSPPVHGTTKLYERISDAPWEGHTISEAKLLPVNFADMDNDQDLDVIGTDTELGQIIWLVNDGSPWDGRWEKFLVEDNFDAPGNAIASDIDSDGDLDIIGANYSGGIFWWEQSTQRYVFLPLVINQ